MLREEHTAKRDINRTAVTGRVLPALLAGFLLAGMTAVSAGQEWTFQEGAASRVRCRWMEEPVQVDGVLDEWATEDFAIFLDREQVRKPGKSYGPPVAGGDEDCSGRVALRWDGEFLYIALDARDDELAPVDAQRGYGRPWEHDGLLVRLHAPPALEATGRYGPELRLNPSDNFLQLGLSYYPEGVAPRELPGRSHYVARATEDGYVVEAAIELAALGYRDPSPGDRLKISLILVDRDPSAEGAASFGQILWHAGGDIREWADMRLMRHGAGADAVTWDSARADTVSVRVRTEALRPGVVLKDRKSVV